MFEKDHFYRILLSFCVLIRLEKISILTWYFIIFIFCYRVFIICWFHKVLEIFVDFSIFDNFCCLRSLYFVLNRNCSWTCIIILLIQFKEGKHLVHVVGMLVTSSGLLNWYKHFLICYYQCSLLYIFSILSLNRSDAIGKHTRDNLTQDGDFLKKKYSVHAKEIRKQIP